MGEVKTDYMTRLLHFLRGAGADVQQTNYSVHNKRPVSHEYI